MGIAGLLAVACLIVVFLGVANSESARKKQKSIN